MPTVIMRTTICDCRLMRELCACASCVVCARNTNHIRGVADMNFNSRKRISSWHTFYIFGGSGGDGGGGGVVYGLCVRFFILYAKLRCVFVVRNVHRFIPLESSVTHFHTL